MMNASNVLQKGNLSTKKMSLKSLMSQKALVCMKKETDIFQEASTALRQAILAVFHNKTISHNLEELFNFVQCVCVQKMMPDLYQMIDGMFQNYVKELLPSFQAVCLDLKTVSKIWETYCKKMLKIRSIFIFLDRQVQSLPIPYQSTWDLALSLFRKEIASVDTISNRIIGLVLTDIKCERMGEKIDRGLLKSVIRMYIDLHLYEPVFKSPFLRDSQQLYAAESQHLSLSLSTSEYMFHVAKRIVEENDRLRAYLDIHSTSTELIQLLETELIQKVTDHLLDSGFEKLALEHRLDDLSLMYRLLLRTNQGSEKLRARFKAHVKCVVKRIVENPTGDVAKDKQMVPSLLSARDTFTGFISDCFERDNLFHKAMHDAFTEAVNVRTNVPAEFLAKYLDSHLKAGNKSQSEEELDRLMEKAMCLFRAIEGKDVFEAFYTKELAKRLLLGRSASIDAEKAMLSKLKQECGHEYTRKLETMFKDNELSKELSKNFRAYHQQSVADGLLPPSNIDLNVNVICPASWPTYPKMTANYPKEMEQLRECFTQFYLSRHNGRRLTYQPSLGTCLVKAVLANNIHKELQVSEFQALILLKMNGPLDQVFTFKELLDGLGVEENELKRALLSLSVGKDQKILLKKPMSIEITPDDEFKLNVTFKHKLTRIKFNQVQMKETKEERQETEERVLADRVAIVDCCVVRIMKTRKQLEHNNLMAEVYKQIHFPLKPADVKKRIENLIERDYIKRDAGNAAIYHYMA